MAAVADNGSSCAVVNVRSGETIEVVQMLFRSAAIRAAAAVAISIGLRSPCEKTIRDQRCISQHLQDDFGALAVPAKIFVRCIRTVKVMMATTSASPHREQPNSALTDL